MTAETTEVLFKGAMRRLASGVALVTTADAQGAPYGIAMTAFMSLSMDPPSLLLAINQTASLCAPLLERGHFAVNILARDQRAQCQAFVSAPPAERFAVLDWTAGPHGIPVVQSATANILCAVGEARLVGTHMVVQGLVEQVMLGSDADPLIYLDGRYGGAAFDD